MDSAVINLRTSKTLKAQAQEVAEQLGFSLSAIINAYLQQLVRTKTVVVSLNEIPNAYLKDVMEQATSDRKAGKTKQFSSVQKAVDYLDGVVK